MKHFATTEKPVATAVATVSEPRRISQTITVNPQERQTHVAGNEVSPRKRPQNENPPTRYRQPFRIKSFVNPRTGSQSWRVSGSKRDGTRIRENFAELRSAQCRQVELTTEWLARETESVARATTLTESQVRLAEAAFLRLDSDEELPLAVDHWLRHGRQHSVAESPRVDEAVEAFQRWLETSTLRDRSRQNLRTRVKVFANSIPNVRVADVTPEIIDNFLEKRTVAASSKDSDRRAISRFFSWCMDRKRRWTTANPCHAVRVEQVERPSPAILNVAECKSLLRQAKKFKHGRIVPYIAVCLFAGLRPFEARRLTWQGVNLTDGEIRLESHQTKTGVPRVISICPALLAWLKAFEGRAFYPPNWRKDFDVLKRAVGYGTKTDKTPNLKPWPEDVMRHTAVSHFFRLTGSYGQTAEQFGNSEPIIKRHYQGRVSSRDTKMFYALLPHNHKR
jgi:integrase